MGNKCSFCEDETPDITQFTKHNGDVILMLCQKCKKEFVLMLFNFRPTSIPQKNRRKKTPCRIPTIDELTEYKNAHGLDVDPETFYCWYEERGWKYKDGTPLGKWELAMRRWHRTSQNKYKQNNQAQTNLLPL